MASIENTTTSKGERRYRVRYRDPSGKTREKWFKRRTDADPQAGPHQPGHRQRLFQLQGGGPADASAAAG